MTEHKVLIVEMEKLSVKLHQANIILRSNAETMLSLKNKLDHLKKQLANKQNRRE